MFYDRFKAACDREGTSMSSILKDCGMATGIIGGWKAGGYPTLDKAEKIAARLGISMDELCYGDEGVFHLSREDREWLRLIHQIPAEKWDMCKDFLATHAAEQPPVPAKKEA